MVNIQLTQQEINEGCKGYTGEQLMGITDSHLSPLTQGIWLWVTELPEDSDFTLADLQQSWKSVPPEEVAQAYQELIDAGYIEE